MLRGLARSWRSLVAVATVFLIAASAGAALRHEPPPARGPALDQLTDASDSDATREPRLSERRLSIESHSSVAPRVAEARLAAESGRPARAFTTTRSVLSARVGDVPLESESGCAATTRWCRAHATSTQAP